MEALVFLESLEVLIIQWYLSTIQIVIDKRFEEDKKGLNKGHAHEIAEIVYDCGESSSVCLKKGVEVKALFKKNHIDLLNLALRLKHWKRRGHCSSTKCLRKSSVESLH